MGTPAMHFKCLSATKNPMANWTSHGFFCWGCKVLKGRTDAHFMLSLLLCNYCSDKPFHQLLSLYWKGTCYI